MSATQSFGEIYQPDFLAVTVDGGVGEQNRVRVEYQEPDVVVEDLGAPLTAGDGCRQVNDHVAACNRGYGSLYIRVGGGDQSDAIEFGTLPTGIAPSLPFTHVTVRGGSGDDVIDGSNNGDYLSGGTGRDTVDGRAGNDTLFEGATHDEPAQVESDTFVGGDGSDLLSYQGRPEPILVDLAQVAGQGASGEDDRASGIEAVAGGHGADLLALAPGGGSADGGLGDDRLTGSPQDDVLITGGGSDLVLAGESDDRIEISGPPSDAPRLSCGDGSDTVSARLSRNGPSPALSAGCEALSAHWGAVSTTPSSGAYDEYAGALGLQASAARTDAFRLPFPAPPTRTACCLRAVEVYGRRGAPSTMNLWGRWCRSPYSKPVLVRLTKLGRKRARPGRRVKAQLKLSYAVTGNYNASPKYTWGLRLKAWIGLPKAQSQSERPHRPPPSRCR